MQTAAQQQHSNPPPFLAFVSRFVAFLLLFLAIKNAYSGSLVLAATLAALVLALSVGIRAKRKGQELPIPVPLILVVLMFTVVYAVYLNGYSRLMWAFPAVIAAFFAAPRRTAIVFSTGTGVVLTGVCLYSGQQDVAIRFAAGLGLSALFLDMATSQINTLQQQIVEASHRDPLTNCFNRRHLEVTATQMRPSRQPAALALLDIDHFKLINDTQGHVAGDEVLVRISDIIRQKAEAEDLLFRIGGEEFVLILPNTEIAQAGVMAERIRDAVSEAKFPVDGRITISAGVTSYDASQPLTVLLERADKLLYAAKNSGRNRVCAEEPAASDARTGEPEPA